MTENRVDPPNQDKEKMDNQDWRKNSKSIKFSELIRKPWFVCAPILIALWILSRILLGAYKIPSASMLPTVGPGDHVLVYNLVSPSDIKPGDLVVYRDPTDGRSEYVKRVVGVAGQKIMYKRGYLWVNGVRLKTKDRGEFEYPTISEDGEITGAEKVRMYDESLGAEKYSIFMKACKDSKDCFMLGVECNLEAGVCFSWDIENVEVPPEHLFVIGDNRHNSQDSRFYGPVHYENVVGRVIMKW